MKNLFLLAFISLPLALQAQNKAQARKDKKTERKEHVNQLIKQEEEGAMIFQKQGELGLKANTDGFSFFYEHGKYKTITKTSLWWIELGEHKDSKQYKGSTDLTIFSGGNPFVYGKQNNFYYFKAGLGGQKVIGGKGNKNGVAVSAVYGGGLSLGMLKPYYLLVINNNSQVTKDIKYTDSTAKQFLQDSSGFSIIGASNFGKGFSEMKFVPGAHVRAALRFDYGHYNETISALEVGINAEYYSQAMPIMIGINEKKKFFLSAYISVIFGRRK